MPTPMPFPGVRLPKKSVSTAEINGSSATIQACRDEPVPRRGASRGLAPSARAVTT